MVQRKKISDLIGHKFGRLKVISYNGRGKWNKHYWFCICKCGGTAVLPTYRITGSKPTVSCGCLRRETMLINRADPTKHTYHNHKLYSIYYGMLGRCYNPKNCRFKYYGARGIQVCDEWLDDCVNFIEWALANGYEDGLTIDRNHRDSNYEPSSCEWVTRSENSRRMNEARRDEGATS